MSNIPLKNFREVGSFDLLSPPLTPLNLVDGQSLNNHLSELIESGSKHIVLDCSGLEFLYSDTLTVLGQAYEVLKIQNGTLGVMTANETIANLIRGSHLSEFLTIYPVETDLIQASLKMMSGSMPKASADGRQDEHTLESFEQKVNEGFESFDSLSSDLNEVEQNASIEINPEPETSTEPENKPKLEPEALLEQDTAIVVEAESELEFESATATEPEPAEKLDPEINTEPKTESETEINIETDLELDSEDETESQSQSSFDHLDFHEKNTAEIEIIQVEEEILETPEEVSQQMPDVDESATLVYEHAPLKKSKAPMVFALFAIIAIAAAAYAYSKGMI